MSNLAIKIIIILALPIIAFLIGRWIMSHLSDRHYVMQQLQTVAEVDRKPFNTRLTGYDLAAVKRHWQVLDRKALRAEQRLLELDLIFPFLYGAALAISLLMAWATLQRPFNPTWLMAPIAITVLADWTENLVLLRQLSFYINRSEEALQGDWIQIASIATVLKLVFFTGSCLFLVWLVAVIVIRVFRSA